MIIDFRFSAPTRHGLAEYVTPPPSMQGFAAAYGDRVYGGGNSTVREMSPSELVQLLDEFGVDKAVVKSSDNQTTRGSKYPMDQLAAYLEGCGDRVIGTAGVDPHKGMEAVRELEWAARDLGLRGVNISPIAHKLRADDRRYYPIYAAASELGIPVLIHSSIHFSNDLVMDMGHPRHIDVVAVEFPELKIVCVHGGWPWVLDTMALAWRHPNVYIEISGVRTKYLALAGTGWEPLMVYGNSILSRKVLWGSNWPQVDPRESIETIRSFPLKESTKAQWLGENAAQLFGVSTTEHSLPAAKEAPVAG